MKFSKVVLSACSIMALLSCQVSFAADTHTMRLQLWSNQYKHINAVGAPSFTCWRLEFNDSPEVPHREDYNQTCWYGTNLKGHYFELDSNKFTLGKGCTGANGCFPIANGYLTIKAWAQGYNTGLLGATSKKSTKMKGYHTANAVAHPTSSGSLGASSAAVTPVIIKYKLPKLGSEFGKTFCSLTREATVTIKDKSYTVPVDTHTCGQEFNSMCSDNDSKSFQYTLNCVNLLDPGKDGKNIKCVIAPGNLTPQNSYMDKCIKSL